MLYRVLFNMHMKRTGLVLVILLAMAGWLANDVAGDSRLLSRAFVAAWDRAATQASDVVIDHQEPLRDEPLAEVQRCVVPTHDRGTPRPPDTQWHASVIVAVDVLSRAPPSA